MEQLYAFEVYIIQHIQKWFMDSEDYFMFVNKISNPHYGIEYLFPLISMVDSVFAAQLLLCVGFGGWATTILKWWLLEERPYWWVRETTFYGRRGPVLRQNSQTCETGPGCPSGHTTTMAMEVVLVVMWMSHVIQDRKINWWWWGYLTYAVFTVAMCSVMLARMFVVAHFPHQCVMGALLGTFLAPALCIYVSDPYIWRYGPHATMSIREAMTYHTLSALTGIAISLLTYYSLQWCGIDPLWSITLARKHCQVPGAVHHKTTPLYSLADSTGSLLGWALSVTPSVAKYRHDTSRRSLVIAFFATSIIYVLTKEAKRVIHKDDPSVLYIMVFIMAVIRPFLYLQVVPFLATLPYASEAGKKKKKK